MARRSRNKSHGRSLDGVFLLDKPTGISSNAALQQVKTLFGAAKAGHTGSLDPLATGMLPICFGEATKFSQFMLEADKRYRTTAKLGVRTASADSESETIAERPVPGFSQDAIEQALNNFRGAIMQVPSMYSALKHKGQPLYKLARQGIEVERPPREVSVFDIKLLALREDEMDIEIHCSKGTYVRTLVDDLGELLGCGAHVTALRRLTVGHFDEQEMTSMPSLDAVVQAHEDVSERYQALQSYVLPTTAAVGSLPQVELTDLLAFYVKQGQAVFVPNTQLCEGNVVLCNKEAEGTGFMGVGEVLDDGRVAPRRLINMAS